MASGVAHQSIAEPLIRRRRLMIGAGRYLTVNRWLIWLIPRRTVFLDTLLRFPL
jgi:hypothetical protein